MASGVYVIENINRPGKVYVGSAANLSSRRDNHFWRLRKNDHHSKKLQHSFNLHGEGCFSFRVLLLCEKKDTLMYEQRAIDAFDAVVSGYNTNPIAGSNLGRKWDESARSKMSLARKGRSIKQPFGRKATLDHRQKISAALKGKAKSEAHGRAISIAKKGVAVSVETRANMAAARLGKKQSAETIAKRNATLSAMRARGEIRNNSARNIENGRFSTTETKEVK